jgi:hypothetical protein
LGGLDGPLTIIDKAWTRQDIKKAAETLIENKTPLETRLGSQNN